MPTTQFPIGNGDGYIYTNASGGGSAAANFATARAASSGTAVPSNANYLYGCYLGVGFTSDVDLYRGFLPVDTSGLGSSATIASATLYAYAWEVATGQNGSLCLVAGTQASTSTLSGSDFPSVGSTEFATRQALSGITVNSWVAFALNASGLAAINQTGFTKFATRISFDLDNSTTGWVGTLGASYVTFRPSEYTTDTTKRPYLEVTYTVSAGSPFARRRPSGLYTR